MRQLYIEGMPLTGAAVTCGVSYDTARDWKTRAKSKGDDWDTARAAYRISDQGVDDLNKQMVEDIRAGREVLPEKKLSRRPVSATLWQNGGRAEGYDITDAVDQSMSNIEGGV